MKTNNAPFKAKTPTHRDFARKQPTTVSTIVPELNDEFNYQDNYDQQIEYLEIMEKVIHLQIEELKLLKALDELEVGL